MTIGKVSSFTIGCEIRLDLRILPSLVVNSILHRALLVLFVRVL